MAKQVQKSTSKVAPKKVMMVKKTSKPLDKGKTRVSTLTKTTKVVSKPMKKESGYGAKDFSRDSTKVRKSLSTMDSIDKETDKNLYIPALGGRFMNPGDDTKRKAAQDTLMAAGARMYKNRKK